MDDNTILDDGVPTDPALYEKYALFHLSVADSLVETTGIADDPDREVPIEALVVFHKAGQVHAGIGQGLATLALAEAIRQQTERDHPHRVR